MKGEFERHHQEQEECGCCEPRPMRPHRAHKATKCTCGCHQRIKDSGCGCGCHVGGFRRRFVSREERIALLEQYLKELQAEAQAVCEHIEELKAKAQCCQDDDEEDEDDEDED